MRVSSRRLTAALTTAALGASLGVSAVDAAAAGASPPTLPDLGSLPVSNIGSIETELEALQAVAPGGSLPAGSLSTLEGSVTTLVGGGTIGTLLTALNTVLGANPASAPFLTGLLADIQSAGGGSANAGTLSAIEAALTTAGLAQILNQVPGVDQSQITAALSELAALQGLPVGGSVPSGNLGTVASLLSTIAGESGVSGTPAATALNQAAAALNNGSVSPAQLEAVIGQIQSAASSAPAPFGSANGALSALAAQLADGSNVFGGLGSLGNPPSAATVSQALSALSSLSGLPAGGTLGNGSLAPLGAILTQVASEPGVSGTPAASTLTAVAGVLDNPAATLGSTQFSYLAGLLQSAASQLPAPLGGPGGVVTGVAAALSSAAGSSGGSGGGGSTGSGGGAGGSTGSGGGSGGSTGAGGGSSTSKPGSTTTVGKPGSTKKVTPAKVTTHGGTLKVTKVSRSTHGVKATVTCTASKGRTCTGTVGVSESGYTTLNKKVSVGGTAKKTWSFTLKAKKTKKAAKAKNKKRPALRLIVHSGSYRYNHLLR